ncbi:hypothetical protein CFB46_00725 [Burkholderia sp. HI2761]|nr:hypothetical protein [Burkholderia sp. BE24]OXJ30225.1 hypothetical protein CFB46_00725 [Burkholderia sp. HI2761]
MARDSRHCRESRRAVQFGAGMSCGRDLPFRPDRRKPVSVGRPVQFSQKCLRPYLSVCGSYPKYWCH